MNLPERLSNAQSWTLVGPMGPALPEKLLKYPVLAVDGGANFSTRIDVWTGDQDSLQTIPSCELKLILRPSKDFSDLVSAFQILSGARASELHLWGFMGGRLDHELFNLGEAVKFLSARSGHKIYFYNEKGNVIVKILGSGTHEFSCHGTFSLAVLDKTMVQLTGNCLYPIPERKEISPLSSFGLSNVGTGEMKLENSSPLILLFPELT